MKQTEVFAMLSKPDICHYFDEMSQVHMYTKHYLLISEEISEDGITFLQPLKEHRDAYDHLMRVFALSMKDREGAEAEKYALDNVKKAFGHEYRAFFDTADWFTYICRKYIREELSFRAKKKKYEQTYADFEEVKTFLNEVPFLYLSIGKKKMSVIMNRF
ncbi:hypothetical protein D3Z36_15005 [Lachnospiraceae bacterium]|nr:hypothetical protein [Lachnospiraceae bacterium]